MKISWLDCNVAPGCNTAEYCARVRYGDEAKRDDDPNEWFDAVVFFFICVARANRCGGNAAKLSRCSNEKYVCANNAASLIRAE